MIKVVCLFKKRKDLTSEEFRRHYEDRHSKIVRKHINRPGVERYVRRYLTPVTNPVSGNTVEAGYDVIMEMWLKDSATFEALYVNPLDSSILPEIIEDEERFLDRSHMSVYTVEEFDTPLDYAR